MTPAARAGVIVAGLFTVVAVVLAILTVAARQTTTVAAPTSAVSATTGAAPSVAAPTTPAPETPAPETPAPETPASTPSPDPQAAAHAALVAARARTLQQLTLNGRWVLQLSSKTDGIVDPLQLAPNGTHTFRYADIQAQFDELSAQAEGAGMVPMVLTAKDFGKTRTPDGEQMWVLLADPGAGSSEASAKAACQRLFPRLSGAALTNACVPRTLVPPP